MFTASIKTRTSSVKSFFEVETNTLCVIKEIPFHLVEREMMSEEEHYDLKNAVVFRLEISVDQFVFMDMTHCKLYDDFDEDMLQQIKVEILPPGSLIELLVK